MKRKLQLAIIVMAIVIGYGAFYCIRAIGTTISDRLDQIDAHDASIR